MKGKAVLFGALLAGALLAAPGVAQADTYYMDHSTNCPSKHRCQSHDQTSMEVSADRR